MATGCGTRQGLDRQSRKVLPVRTPDDVDLWSVFPLHQAGPQGNVTMLAVVSKVRHRSGNSCDVYRACHGLNTGAASRDALFAGTRMIAQISVLQYPRDSCSMATPI